MIAYITSIVGFKPKATEATLATGYISAAWEGVKTPTKLMSVYAVRDNLGRLVRLSVCEHNERGVLSLKQRPMPVVYEGDMGSREEVRKFLEENEVI